MELEFKLGVLGLAILSAVVWEAELGGLAWTEVGSGAGFGGS